MVKKDKLLLTAQKFLQKNNLSRAIKEYLKIIDLDPKDMRSRQKLAELYSRTSKIDEALSHYAVVANYYAENTFFLKAIAVYKQMQKLAPDDADYTLKLAHLNEQQGLIGNALSEYRILLAVYEKTDEIDKIIDVLNKMRALDPENITIAVRIAEFYAQTGDNETAQQEFDTVEEKLLQLGNYQQLHKFYEHFMSVWPDNVSVKIGFGQAMVDGGEPLGGVEFLTKLQRQYPKDPNVLFALARGFRACADFTHEFECMERLTKWVPDSLEYQLALFDAALATENFKQVFADLEQGKQIFEAADRVAELKPYYEKLREHLPDDRNVLASLQDIYEQLGEGEKLFDAISSDFTDVSNDNSETFNTQETSVDDHLSFDELQFDTTSSEPDGGVNNSFDDITFNIASNDSSSDVGDDIEFNIADSAKSAVDIQADLEEADFYLQQGLAEEAQQVCDRLVLSNPDNDKVVALKQQLLQRQQLHKVSEPLAEVIVSQSDININTDDSTDDSELILDLDISGLDSDFSGVDAVDTFDFDDGDIDIESSLSGLQDEDSSPQPELADSQRGVVTVISDEDTESAYNLGIAYKEMGLIDDAIAEFNKAMNSPARKIDCITLKTGCYIDQQKFDAAEETLTVGLSDSSLSKKEQVLLFYESGLLYEAWGRFADALSSYQVVADNDSSFRDVAAKVAELTEIVNNEGATSNDRVSYL